MDQADIQLVNPLEVSDWDARLGHLPAATFFHSAAWARVLSESYAYQPVYLASGTSTRYRSVLPIMEVDSWLTGRRGVSLPFTDECEPLALAGETILPLFRRAQDHGKARGWKYLEIRGGHDSFGGAPASTSFLNHRLTLHDDEASLRARFDSSVRRALRKAEQSDLTIEFSQSLDSMRIFYRLLCLTRQRHGVPPQPFLFFANIQRHVLARDQGWTVLARRGNVPVAGAIFFHFGKSVIYKFGASNEAFQQFRANNLVMWHAIRHYAKQRFTTFDLGRSSLDNEGLRRFKLGWCTLERKIGYVRYDLKAGRFVTAGDGASGWHTRFFQRTPVFISRLIGTALYRHIA